jgi:hypothetical protein
LPLSLLFLLSFPKGICFCRWTEGAIHKTRPNCGCPIFATVLSSLRWAIVRKHDPLSSPSRKINPYPTWNASAKESALYYPPHKLNIPFPHHHLQLFSSKTAQKSLVKPPNLPKTL